MPQSERLKQAAAGTARADCATGTGRCAGQGSVVGGTGGCSQIGDGGGAGTRRRSASQTISASRRCENYTNVTAPLDGVVIWRYADTGALIQGGTNSNDQALPIVRLSQSNLLRLRIPVPEDDVKYVHAGDQLQVRVDAIGRSFTGKIVRFTRDVNFETRTMETEVDVENKDLSIAPGMYANTHAATGARNQRGDDSRGSAGAERAAGDGLRARRQQSHSYSQGHGGPARDRSWPRSPADSIPATGW